MFVVVRRGVSGMDGGASLQSETTTAEEDRRELNCSFEEMLTRVEDILA